MLRRSVSTERLLLMQHALLNTRLGPAIILASFVSGNGIAAVPAQPHYVTIMHKVDVARPAAVVWARVGHYCDLTKWLGKPCEIVEGRDGQVGAVRRVDHQTTEILVGRTATSYTYAQPEKEGAQTHFYHGTLDVEPTGGGTSQIVYTLFYDNGAITDPAARAKELAERSALFAKAVNNMKSIAEASRR